MSGRCEREHRCRGPPQRIGKRDGEEVAGPAEGASNIGATAEKSDGFGGEGAGEKQREQQ
jgi:hypothetical protein